MIKVHAPIIGFLSSLTIVYFLLEINAIYGVLSPLVTLPTTILYQDIAGLEIRILFLLEEILLNPIISSNQNYLLHYVGWGVGGFSSGVIVRNKTKGFLAGLSSIIVGILITWLMQWFLIYGFESSSLSLIINIVEIGNMFLGIWGALFVATAMGILGGHLTQSRR